MLGRWADDPMGYPGTRAQREWRHGQGGSGQLVIQEKVFIRTVELRQPGCDFPHKTPVTFLVRIRTKPCIDRYAHDIQGVSKIRANPHQNCIPAKIKRYMQTFYRLIHYPLKARKSITYEQDLHDPLIVYDDGSQPVAIGDNSAMRLSQWRSP
jgi:hypothetical protein